MNTTPNAELAPTLSPKQESDKRIVIVIYALYLLSLFIGLTWIAAVIIHYIKRPEIQDAVLRSHLNWQIRTFWLTLLGCIIGGVLSFFLVGFLVLFAVVVWFLYRMIRGLLALLDNKPMPPPQSL